MTNIFRLMILHFKSGNLLLFARVFLVTTFQRRLIFLFGFGIVVWVCWRAHRRNLRFRTAVTSNLWLCLLIVAAHVRNWNPGRFTNEKRNRTILICTLSLINAGRPQLETEQWHVRLNMCVWRAYAVQLLWWARTRQNKKGHALTLPRRSRTNKTLLKIYARYWKNTYCYWKNEYILPWTGAT